MGNPRPSFAMMTVRGACGTDDGACPAELGARRNATPVNVSLCFLPSQWSTFRLYGALGVVTVFAAASPPSSTRGGEARSRRGRRRAARRG